MPLVPTHTPALPTAATRAVALPRGAHPPEGESGAEPASGLSPAQLFHALRRRWLIAVPLAAAMSALVYLGAESRLTPVYTARTLIHVAPDRPGLLYDNVGGRPDTVSFQRTQLAAVKSQFVRQAVVRELQPLNLASLHTKQDPVLWLEKEINADFTITPETLRVTMKGSDPDELKLLVNTLGTTYLREFINRDRTEWSTRLEALKKKDAEYESALKVQRQQLTTRAEHFGAPDLPALREKSAHVAADLRTLKVQLTVAEAEAKDAGTALPEPNEEPAIDPAALEAALEKAVAADQKAGELRETIAKLDKARDDFERHLLKYQDDPDYKKVVADLAAARASLTSRHEALRKTVTDQLRPTKPQKLGAAPPATNKRLIARLKAEIQQKEREASELANGIAELERLRKEMLPLEEQHALVKARMIPLEVEPQTLTRAWIIEEALIVEAPKGDRALKMAVAPAGVAFFAVIFFVAWLDLRRGRVNSGAELEAARIRVIGAVPAVRANVLPVFAPPTQDRARREFLQLADAIDMTRAVIAPVLASARGYTLVVTSAAAGEGKTVVSAHLAARFARSGLRTLLIDTDVRRPRIAQLFGLNSGAGFGEWVSGRVSLTEVVNPGPVTGLDVVSAGGCDARTVAELLDLNFPELLRAAKEEYDVVVIDTAPLLCAPETLAVCRLADGVVLSVMRDVSRLPGIQACTERLASINATVLGAIITGDAPARYESY